MVEGGKNGGDATREEIKEGMGKPPFTPAGERDFEKCVSGMAYYFGKNVERLPNGSQHFLLLASRESLLSKHKHDFFGYHSIVMDLFIRKDTILKIYSVQGV